MLSVTKTRKSKLFLKDEICSCTSPPSVFGIPYGKEHPLTWWRLVGWVGWWLVGGLAWLVGLAGWLGWLAGWLAGFLAGRPPSRGQIHCFQWVSISGRCGTKPVAPDSSAPNLPSGGKRIASRARAASHARTHARTNERNESDFPVGLPPQPPIYSFKRAIHIHYHVT